MKQFLFLSLATLVAIPARAQMSIDLSALKSPILFKGDATTAYRDPAAVYSDGVFHLYFTLVKTMPGGQIYMHTAWSKSEDLAHWTEPKIFTPRDRSQNFSSPGSVIHFGNEWVICLQTYPRPKGEKFGNENARLWLRASADLEHWEDATWIPVKGPDVPFEKLGRMIDPFLFPDKAEQGKWWCIYKQNGLNLSWSRDLETWTPAGHTDAGENPCVLVEGDEYILFHSPANGIGMKRSRDLKEWKDAGVTTLGQKDWPWAQGRLTAGFVMDLRKQPGIGKYLMFFHGSAYPENDPRGGFDNFASIGLAWSDDLKTWHWPGEGK